MLAVFGSLGSFFRRPRHDLNYDSEKKKMAKWRRGTTSRGLKDPEVFMGQWILETACYEKIQETRSKRVREQLE